VGADHPDYRTELEDFLAVLAQPGDEGQPFIVVGGHGANYWAKLYLPREPRLATHLPFTSKDLDLVGSRASALRVAQILGWTFLEPPIRGGPVQGVISSSAEPTPLTVEFLTEIKGVPADTIRVFTRANLIRPEGTERPMPIRVLDPVMLLAGKVRNAVDIGQDAPERPRQDVKHVAMLGLCVPHFLVDLLAESPAATQAEMLQKYAAVLAALKRSYSGRTFEARHPGTIHWADLVPAVIKQVALDETTRAALRELGSL